VQVLQLNFEAGSDIYSGGNCSASDLITIVKVASCEGGAAIT
jgi:hypothetical protein